MVGDRARYQQALRWGYAFNQRQMWPKALEAFGAAISEFPREAEPYAGLGETCFGAGRLDRALESYKMAARYSRGDLTHLRRVADLQERTGQLREAARTYMAAGEIYLRRRRLDDAIDHWARAVRLEPGLLGAHRRLAMVFQRKGNTKAAVREYLAIARIYLGRGEPDKALLMCRAALRLDPDSEDARLAAELVRQGEAALETEEEAQETPSATAVAEFSNGQAAVVTTVRQIADVLEAERRQWQRRHAPARQQDAVSRAVRSAQDTLAEEIFREEIAADNEMPLSKLERDALVGQGMDFLSRGDSAHAIECYERAADGGTRMPAIYLTLGALYMEVGAKRKARRALAQAAREPAYRDAIRTLLGD